jgi:hypothetical protein
VRKLLLVFALFVVGCGAPVIVRAPVLYPARVPVRSFPELIITGAALPEGDLVGRLVAHLSGAGGHVVRRVDVKELEPMRQSGAISPLALVLLVEPALFRETRNDWDLVPVQVCDFYWGCFIDYQSVYVSSPALVGQARLTIYEGHTARTLQTELFETLTFADDTKESRREVLDQLALQLERAVDVLRSEKRLELLPVEQVPAVQQAIAAIGKSDWRGGLALLEQAAKQLGGQSRHVQARVWYDLGMARWHASESGELEPAAYESAKRALALAASLDKRFEPAVASLERARERQRLLEEQRRATEHNRKLYESVRAAAPRLIAPTETEPARAPSSGDSPVREVAPNKGAPSQP